MVLTRSMIAAALALASSTALAQGAVTLYGGVRSGGDFTDQNANETGHKHRAESDRQRNPPAIEQARQDVRPEIVGPEGMRPRRSLELRGEIDLVDRHPPYQRSQQDRGHDDRQHDQAHHGEAMTAEPAQSFAGRREARFGPRCRAGRSQYCPAGLRLSGKRYGGRASHTGYRR